MGQRLYRGHAHKCRKPQIDPAKLIAVGLKVGPEQAWFSRLKASMFQMRVDKYELSLVLSI